MYVMNVFIQAPLKFPHFGRFVSAYLHQLATLLKVT
jgi:hypothetical protein